MGMQIVRSTKCSLRFATAHKRKQWNKFLVEYVRVVNLYIDRFWFNTPKSNKELIKPLLNSISNTWLTQRAKQCAARQALGMIFAVRERIKTARKNKEKCKTTPRKPVLRKLKAELSSQCATFAISKSALGFDAWLHLNNLGNSSSLDLPVKLHKHYHGLSLSGKRCNQFIITDKYIQIPFKITVAEKQPKTGCVGVDSGINALASTSTGEQFGTEIKAKIQRVKRCKHGSKGQQRARRSLRHYIDITAKQVLNIEDMTLLVVEKLKNITRNTKKRRVNKDTRYLLGSWNVRYWLKRLEMGCERNRVSFRTVPAYNTSRTCPSCGHCCKANRNGTEFRCLECGFSGNADITASNTILNRFLNGKYGKDCTRLPSKLSDFGLNLISHSTSSQRNNTTVALSNGQVRDEIKTTPEHIVPVTNT